MTEQRNSTATTGATGAPQVVVVVATLGKSPVLQRCFEAIEQQRSATALELLVISQGSLSSDAQRLIEKSADRHLHRSEELGFAEANNVALSTTLASETKYVALINDDAVVSASWLEKLLQTLTDNPKVAAAQGANFLHQERQEDEQAPLVDGFGIAWRRWQAVQIGHGEHLSTQEVDVGCEDGDTASRPVFGVSATAALYRCKALREVAFSDGASAYAVFDQTLETYYEDVDLACRLRAAGWQSVCVPNVTCEHLSSASAPSHRARLLIANRHLVLARALGRAYLGRLPHLLARDVADFGLHTASGWLRAARLLPRYLHRGRPQTLDSSTEPLGAAPVSGSRT